MQKNEDVMQITLNLIKKLNVDIEEEDISIAHRLPRKRRGQTRANKATNHSIIIVRLVSRQKRNKIYANRFKAKDIEGFSIDDMKKLCVNKNLKQRRKRLFWNTKQKFRSYMADLKHKAFSRL